MVFFTSLGILCKATIYRAPSSKPNEKIQLTFIMFARRIFECIEWHSVCHFTHTYQSLWDPLETSIEYICSFNKQFLCLTMHTFVSTIQSEKQLKIERLMRVKATNVKSTVDIWIRHLQLCLDLCHDIFHGFAIHFYKKERGALFPHFSQSMQYNLHLETVFTKRNRAVYVNCVLCNDFEPAKKYLFLFFWKKTLTDLSVCF